MWAVEPSQACIARDKLMLTTWSLWLAEPARARDVLVDHARQNEGRLALYERIERERAGWCRWAAAQIDQGHPLRRRRPGAQGLI